MPKETVYYRVDDLPEQIADQFERAVQAVSQAAQTKGEGQVSQTRAFVALAAAGGLEEAVASGQALAANFKPSEPKVDRGYHVPADLKDRLRAVAESKGVKVGAVGRLLLISKAAGHLVGSIEEGLTAGRAEEVQAARLQEAPA